MGKASEQRRKKQDEELARCSRHAAVFSGRWLRRLEGNCVKALQGRSLGLAERDLEALWLDELKRFGTYTLQFETESDPPETLEIATRRLARLAQTLCTTCSAITRRCLSGHPELLSAVIDLAFLAAHGSDEAVRAAWMDLLYLWQREIARTFDAPLEGVLEGERSSWHLVDDAQLILDACASVRVPRIHAGNGDSLVAATADVLSHTFCREAAACIDSRLLKENSLARKQREAAAIIFRQRGSRSLLTSVRRCINA